MGPTQQCPNCGFDLTDTSAVMCPMCGETIAPDAATMQARPKTYSNPILYKIIDLGIAALGAVFVLTLVLGVPFYLNARNESELYQGQQYRLSNFKVIYVHYQPSSTGTDGQYTPPSFIAKGTVEGKTEWMELRSCLAYQPPQSQLELVKRVPAGTEIPVYFFPDLKEGYRVRLLSGTPPAEEGRQFTSIALRYGIATLAVCAIGVLVLVPLRRLCTT